MYLNDSEKRRERENLKEKEKEKRVARFEFGEEGQKAALYKKRRS